MMPKWIVRKGLAVAVAALALVASASTAFAQFATQSFTSDYSGVYVAGRVSYTSFSVAQQYQITGAAGTAATTADFSYNSSPISLAPAIGYRYNAYLGAEASAYIPVTFPQSTFTNSVAPAVLATAPTGLNSSGTANYYTTTESAAANYTFAYSAALVGSYPLSPEFLLFVKLGVGGALVPEEMVAFLPTGQTGDPTMINISEGLTPVGFSFGGGLSFRVSRNFGLSLEYEQTVLGGAGAVNASSVTMSNISLSGTFHF